MDEMDSARKHDKAKWSLRGEKGEKGRNVGASVAKARTGEGGCCVWLRRVVRGRVGEIRGSGAGGWQSMVCLNAWEPGARETTDEKETRVQGAGVSSPSLECLECLEVFGVGGWSEAMERSPWEMLQM